MHPANSAYSISFVVIAAFKNTGGFMTQFIEGYEYILHHIAEIAVYTLELIGILIIVIGTLHALSLFIVRIKRKEPTNVVLALGRSLALALEFKMGAEIVNTVIVRELSELAVLTVVILIRALLAFIIHWEMRMENSHQSENSDHNGEKK